MTKYKSWDDEDGDETGWMRYQEDALEPMPGHEPKKVVGNTGPTTPSRGIPSVRGHRKGGHGGATKMCASDHFTTSSESEDRASSPSDRHCPGEAVSSPPWAVSGESLKSTTELELGEEDPGTHTASGLAGSPPSIHFDPVNSSPKVKSTGGNKKPAYLRPPSPFLSHTAGPMSSRRRRNNTTRGGKTPSSQSKMSSLGFQSPLCEVKPLSAPKSPANHHQADASPRRRGSNVRPRAHPGHSTSQSHRTSTPATSWGPKMDSGNTPAMSLMAPWRTWESLAIRLSNVPPEATTFMVWEAFRKEGHVVSIDLFEDSQGNRIRKGKIWFRPPPKEDFWRTGLHPIILAGRRRAYVSVYVDGQQKQPQVPSPVTSGILYPADITLPIISVDIGIMKNHNTMLSLRPIQEGLHQASRLVIDLRHREISIYFHLGVLNRQQDTAKAHDTSRNYRLKFHLQQLARILQTSTDALGLSMSHIICVDTPPLYHRRLKNVSSTFPESANSWRDEDSWFRQTDIVHVPENLARLPVSLRKHASIINIGRWTTFRIGYPEQVDKDGKLQLVRSVLKDFNVDIDTGVEFTVSSTAAALPVIWDWIDPPVRQLHSVPSSSMDDLQDDNYIHLLFSVRYQLEVCLSNGYLSEYSAGKEFVETLAQMNETEAKNLLEHVAVEENVYHDPMKIFDITFVRGVTTVKIPSYCCYMRSATVTPSTVYYHTPSVDISNRVIRHYIEYADRFLRVRFTDEKLQGRINAIENSTMDAVFTRIKRAMMNGITLGDRHYEFLAFGNSQFREHGAYFFASLPTLSASHIRAWMGHFNEIRNIAKFAARLGQCFSTTRAIVGCSVQVREIDDVKRNGFTFSDGVGRISKFLAQMVATELKITTSTREPPSAFQFRLGGCKGMLAISPEAQRQEVHIRPSQYKFPTIHNGLEIIRWSQFSMATLNRQIIIVLSSLGISDEVFHDKLRIMLTNLDNAMTNDSQAVSLLEKYVDPNQMTIMIAQMVRDGFQKFKEPFLTSILSLWRAWQIKYLKEKAKIVIDQGACLLGCMDETGTLKGYYREKIPKAEATLEEKLAALPEIFVQIPRADQGGKYQIVEGPCILARNPSLHPGDARVVNAVNCPKLSYLRDVVVLPKLGDRDIPSMCSGGDLDGDDYLVIWDQDLLPSDWFREPMDYTGPKTLSLDRDVSVNDITSFFVTYMKNDYLPRIAHAHLAWADLLPGGVNEDRCLCLAQLHSDAVDYNKTGNPAKMTRDLKPRRWPHFMEKNHKRKEQIYRSGKILGQLYDAVERVDFIPSIELSFDDRILQCGIEVSEDLMEFARTLKNTYDSSMRRIMAQHDIKTEFEVWSTFVLSHSKKSSDYKFHEEIGGISSSLRDRFRKTCYDKVGSWRFEVLAPLVVAMYKVTMEEVNTCFSEHRRRSYSPDILLLDLEETKVETRDLPFISFPWIFPEILGKIAMSHYDPGEDVSPIVYKHKAETAPEKRFLSLGSEHGVETATGIQQFGSVLQLFQDNPAVEEGDGEHRNRPNSKEGIHREEQNEQSDTGSLPGSPKVASVPLSSPTPVPTNRSFDHESRTENLRTVPDANHESDGKLSTPRGATPEFEATGASLNIVEEEGDIKPSALDMLADLLGLSLEDI